MTTRIHNGKLIVFYSPQEIEQLIPVQVRVAKSKEHSGVFSTGETKKRIIRGGRYEN